jgi:hypothetical protein
MGLRRPTRAHLVMERAASVLPRAPLGLDLAVQRGELRLAHLRAAAAWMAPEQAKAQRANGGAGSAPRRKEAHDVMTKGRMTSCRRGGRMTS